MFLPENIPLISKISGTQIQLAATYLGQSGRVSIGGQQYRLTSALNCDLTTVGYGGLASGSLAANTLYYIYVVVNGSNVPGLVCATTGPTVGPTGFTAWREVGRFRTRYAAATVADPANLLIGSGRASAISSWVSYTPSGYGDSANWVRGTIEHDKQFWRRVKEDIEISWEYKQTGAGTAGSGNYAFRMPLIPLEAFMFSPDPTKLGTDNNNTSNHCGFGHLWSGLGNSSNAEVWVESGGLFRVHYLLDGSSTYTLWSAANYSFNTPALRLSFRAKVPIAEFAGLFDD